MTTEDHRQCMTYRWFICANLIDVTMKTLPPLRAAIHIEKMLAEAYPLQPFEIRKEKTK